MIYNFKKLKKNFYLKFFQILLIVFFNVMTLAMTQIDNHFNVCATHMCPKRGVDFLEQKNSMILAPRPYFFYLTKIT